MQTDTRKLIQESMRTAFPSVEARVGRFYGMQEYHLGWRDAQLQPSESDPGKLIRPQVVLLAAQVAGGDPAKILPLAAGIQLLHDFTLIHDDIEDNSDARRGRPTLWHIWGLAHGINAGDAMFVVAHLAIHRLVEQGVPAERVLRVLRHFDEVILEVCEGQFLDISFEGDLSIKPDDYLTMIGGKTAALLAGSAALGALAAGASDATVSALSTFGRSLGLAFQIEDDILGIWGDPEVTGKPRAADLYRRKLSLPVIHALAHTPVTSELSALYSRPELDDAAVGQALRLLDTAGSREYSAAIALEHHQAALDALDAIKPEGDAQAEAAYSQLRAITQSLLGRQS